MDKGRSLEKKEQEAGEQGMGSGVSDKTSGY